MVNWSWLAGRAGHFIIYAIFAGLLGMAIYFGFIRPNTKPNPATTQQGQRDNYTYTFAPRQTFGCQNFKIPQPEKWATNSSLLD